MICPDCKKELEKAVFHNVEVDYCPVCLGLWFEEEELRWAKDEKDKNLNWLDFDLWQDQKKFKISQSGRACPACRLPFYEISYGESGIKVDLCNMCKGVWLDRKEFKKIIEYLKQKANYEALNNFSKNLAKELWEIFSGPETFREELADFLTLLKLLRYNFLAKHPILAKIIENLPK